MNSNSSELSVTMSGKGSIPVDYIRGKISVTLLLPGASYPSKDEGRESDVGYDVTLMRRSEDRGEDVAHEVNYFRTGLAISPPPGYHVELIANPTLHRHGYMLATGLGVIDPECSSELLVPLFKYKDGDDLELPFRAVKIVLRKTEYAHIAGVKPSLSGSNGNGGSFGGGYDPSPRGMYIPDMQNAYPPDMSAYNSQVQGYGKGMKRPQAASRGNNHMF